MFSKQIENTVGKDEIAPYEQFCFFPQCFQKACTSERVNSLPNYKILDWSKLKAFADDKIKVTEKLKFVLERVENIVGRGENAAFQHFLLVSQCFQKASYTRSLKVWIMW